MKPSKQRGILFTPENYRKSHDGLKTKTRRIMEFQPSKETTWFGQMRTSGKDDGLWFPMKGNPKDSEEWEQAEGKVVKCPHGVPGDLLYVQETWRTYERPEDLVDGILYKIDNVFVPIQNTHTASDLWVEAHRNGKYKDKWRSPRFMFKWIARLWLELIDVQAERIQDITVSDCYAEGIRVTGSFHRHGAYPESVAEEAKRKMRDLWISIHGKDSWERNDWTWVLEYKVIGNKPT